MERLKRNWLETYNNYKGMAVDYLRNRIEYFNDNSTMKEFGHVITLSRIPLIKRAFWTVTVLASCYAAASVLIGVLEIYRGDAVTFSVETDYLHWDTPFPGVTVCASSLSQIYKEKLKKTKWSYMDKIVAELLNGGGCKRCKTFGDKMKGFNEFEEILDTIKIHCEEMFGDCWWNGEQQPCCELFKPINTSSGSCYAFNSQFDNEDPLKYISRIMGLPTLVFTTNVDVLMKLHSPREILYSLVNSDQEISKTLYLQEHYELIVHAEEIYSDMSVKSVPKQNRECLLEDERPDFVVKWPFKRYSYYACKWYCIAFDQYKFCNCSSNFMPKIDMGKGTVPVCNMEGFICINDYKSLVAKDCQCPMNCDEVNYHLTAEFSTKNKYKQGEFGKAVVNVGQLPSLRMRRHAIRDMLGLVVDFGGVVGVFFGASLLSFIEIVYIFIIRRNM